MRKKEQYRIVGVMLVVLAVGTHFQYFPGFITSTSPLPLTNATNTDSMASNRTLTNQTQMQGVFSFIDTYWLYFLGCGFFFVVYSSGVLDSHPTWHNDWSYHPTTTPNEEDESDVEDVDEEIQEAKSLKTTGVELLKCPHCGAKLKFGSSTVTTCDYCGNEVRRAI